MGTVQHACKQNHLLHIVRHAGQKTKHSSAHILGHATSQPGAFDLEFAQPAAKTRLPNGCTAT